MYVSYKEILAKAWRLTIKNKFLWIFGFFASFISLEAVYEIILGQLNQLKNLQALQSTILGLYENQIKTLDIHIFFINQLAQDNWTYLLFILFITVLVLFAWLVFTAQIVVIKSCALLYQGKKFRLGEVLTASMPKFWSVALINILAKVALYAGFIGFSLPLLYASLTQNTEALFPAFFFYFIFYTVFAIAVSFLTAFATNFIVLKNLHLLEAITQGWHLFSRNIGLSFKIAFILFVLKLISLVIILCLSAIFIIPAVALVIVAVNKFYTLAFVFSLTLIILAFTLSTVLVNAIFTVFYLNTWAITFIKLAEENVFSKILYFIKNFPHAIKTPKKINPVRLNKKLVTLAKQTEKQVEIVGKIVEDKYQVWEPKIKKEGKILLKKLETNYKTLEPQIKKNGQTLFKKLKTNYKILEPQIKKDGQAIIKKISAEYKVLKPKVKKALKKEYKKLAKTKPVKNQKSRMKKKSKAQR